MKLFTTTIYSGLALLAVSLIANNASADLYQRIDNTAADIEAKSIEVIKEVRHYRHTSQYQHLCTDARKLRNLARHIHETVHSAADLNHLSSDLRKMDSDFHHLDVLFNQVERLAAHGNGHVHGDTRHVRGLLNALENCIHSLQSDLHLAQRLEAQRAVHDVRRAHHNRTYNTYGSRGYQTSNVRTVPVYNNGGSRRTYGGCDSDLSRGGVTVGNGNVRFRINF